MACALLTKTNKEMDDMLKQLNKSSCLLITNCVSKALCNFKLNNNYIFFIYGYWDYLDKVDLFVTFYENFLLKLSYVVLNLKLNFCLL